MSPVMDQPSAEQLARLLPAGRADDFFDALYGDAAEGAYDIELAWRGRQGSRLELELRLKQRPGKCLACNLTYGLPTVFARHPVLDLKGMVAGLCELLGADPAAATWELGRTRTVNPELHAIPLYVELGV